MKIMLSKFLISFVYAFEYSQANPSLSVEQIHIVLNLSTWLLGGKPEMGTPRFSLDR